MFVGHRQGVTSIMKQDETSSSVYPLHFFVACMISKKVCFLSYLGPSLNLTSYVIIFILHVLLQMTTLDIQHHLKRFPHLVAKVKVCPPTTRSYWIQSGSPSMTCSSDEHWVDRTILKLTKCCDCPDSHRNCH